MNRRPSNSGPAAPARRSVVWTMTLVISLAAALAGGAIVLWIVYHDLRSSTMLSVGVALCVFGFAASALWLGVWLVSGDHHEPTGGP